VFKIAKNNRLSRFIFFEYRQQNHRLIKLADVHDIVFNVFSLSLITTNVDLDRIGAILIGRI